MSYETPVVNRSEIARVSNTRYNRDIDKAREARDNQLKDSDPMVEKEGFLGMDDLDKMRRRKIR